MTNTQLRIISSLVFASIIIAVLYFGRYAALSLILILGHIVIDEIYINFFKHKRFSIRYLLSQFVFFSIFVAQNFITTPWINQSIINSAAIALNLFLLYMLFLKAFDSRLFTRMQKNFPFISVIMVLLPFLSFSIIFHEEDWLKLLFVIIFLVISTDIGAWFFGRKFGKRKLWRAVSPAKTVEGAIGGIIFALLVSSIYWIIFIGEINIKIIASFILLTILAELGDLVESKLKRVYSIKDSSSLIPGHGGLYDRLDAILFVVPFFNLIFILC